VKRLALDPRFWLISLTMAALGVLHYVSQLGVPGTSPPSEHFGLSRHTLDRILFLVPVMYAGYSFRLRAGLIACLAALLVMLPRVIFLSPAPLDALVETAGVLVVGVLGCVWFEGRQSAREQQQRATREMEAVQETLQRQIRLSRSNSKRLATLNAISGMLSRSLDLESLLRSAIDMVVEVMEAEVAVIFTLGKDPPSFTLAAHEGLSEEFARGAQTLGLADGFRGLDMQTGEPWVIEDAMDGSGFPRELVRQEKIRAQLVVPLRAKGATTGILCVANRRPRHFLSEEVELLTAIGAQIGIALENTKLYREEQRVAAQYRSIFENTREAILVHDLDGNIVAANQAAARLTGHDVEELTRLNVVRFLSDKAVTFAAEIKSKLLEGRMVPGEPYDQRTIRKDGSEAMLRISSTPVCEDGRLVGFQHIAMDVTKERIMEENLRYYISAITRAQEEERKRIARELHDETAQQLIALSHEFESFANNQRLLPEDVETMRTWDHRLKDALQGIRLFSRDLRPPMIDDLGLIPSLEWLTGQFDNESGANVELKVVGTVRRLSPEADLLLFRIVQEALNNVRRHAEASLVEVTLRFSDGRLIVVVKDNGKGFRLPDSVGDLSRSGKLGLAGIEERTRLLGATLKVASEPGQGSTITVEMPI